MNSNFQSNQTIKTIDDIKNRLIDIFLEPFDQVCRTDGIYSVPINENENIVFDKDIIISLNKNLESDAEIITAYKNLANIYPKLHYYFFYRMSQLFNDINLNQLDNEAKNFCISSKWKKDHYKFTPFEINKQLFNLVENSIKKTKSLKLLTINELNKYTYLNMYDASLFYYCVFYKGIDPSQFFVITDSNIDRYIIEFLGCPSDRIFNSIKEYREKNQMKHIDFTIGNPPFTANTDLTILTEVRKISDKVCFVHPATFLIAKGERISDAFSRHIQSNKLKELILFFENNLFNIAIYGPLCISFWDNNYNSSIVKVTDNAFSKTQYKIDINDISIFGKNIQFKNEILNILNKFKENNLGTHQINFPNNITTNFGVQLPAIHGGAVKTKYADGHFALFSNKPKELLVTASTFKWKDKKQCHGLLQVPFEFKTENERENFILYCKSKICRIFNAFYKSNAATYHVKHIPWLDFSKKWDDAQLKKYFNISDALWNYIDNFMPNYYEDYKSGF